MERAKTLVGEYPFLYDWMYRSCIEFEALHVVFLAHAMQEDGWSPTSPFALRHGREYNMVYLKHVAKNKVRFMVGAIYHRYFNMSLLATFPISYKIVQEWIEFDLRATVKRAVLTILETLPPLHMTTAATSSTDPSPASSSICCATIGQRDAIAAAVSPTRIAVSYESSASPCVYTPGAAAQQVHLVGGHTQPVFDMDFCGFEWSNLLTASGDGTVKYWVGKTCTLRSTYKIGFPCWTVAAQPAGGNMFAVGGEYRDFPIIDIERASTSNGVTTVRTFTGHEHDVDVLEWHPHGNYIMSASSDQTLKLWDVGSTKAVRTFHGTRAMSSSTTTMAISPDGKFVSAASCMGTWMTWDIGTQAVVAHGRVPQDTPIYAMTYTPSGMLLLTYGGHVLGVDKDGGDPIHTWSVRRDKMIHMQSFPTLTMVIAV